MSSMEKNEQLSGIVINPDEEDIILNKIDMRAFMEGSKKIIEGKYKLL